ncbi:acyltransferase family protein [Streptomyces sp. NBC_01497]|uniref:acyltransferase family protein n=1 Tax=Streptomyces sp. NBC_01497 TaxID=2903885 RepID=UPI002E341C29|nr:acyltransferase [Streptomyces sp. NBC_01497]
MFGQTSIGRRRDHHQRRVAVIAQVPAPEPPHGTTGVGRLAAIDGLRLVAALSVAMFHYFGSITHGFWGAHDLQQFAPTLHEISRYGWLGVEFFFMISGFVICMSCWGRSPVQFAVSRASRLFPAYWCSLLLIVALVLIARVVHLKTATLIDPRTDLANFTMAPGPLGVGLTDGVAWTLWVEARFYLLMAIMLCVGLTYRRIVAFCGIWLTLSLAAQELDSTVMKEFLIPQYSGLFILGISLYLMHRFGQNAVLWLLAGFSWSYELTLLQQRVDSHGANATSGGHLSWGVCALAITIFAVVLASVAVGPLCRTQSRWLVRAGALTYPFYLVHQSLGVPVAKALVQHVPGMGVLKASFTAIGLSLVLAGIIYRWVDKPGARKMRYWLTRGMNPEGPVPASPSSAM